MSSDMEMKMQARFDAWDAEMAAASADLKAYVHAMMQPNGWRAALAIEKAWALDGYPPAIVTGVLNGVAGGEGFDAALSRLLDGGEE